MWRNPFWPDPELYNCSGHPAEFWEAQRRPHIPDGVVCIVVASICLVAYTLCVISMMDRDLLKNNIWKILFFTGVMDIGGIIVAGHFTGLFYITGEIFCTSPLFNYIVGEFAMGFWICNLFNVVTIGLQRCSEVSSCKFLKAAFRGNMIYIWILSSLFAMWLVMCTTNTTVFNSTHGNWYYVPFISEDRAYELSRYQNVVHPSVNCTTGVLLTAIYVYLCVKMRKEMKTTSMNYSKAQNKLVLQSILICASTALTCYVYIYMQFFPSPYWLVYTASVSWLMSHGLPGFIYLLLNRTIRRKVNTMLGITKRQCVIVGQQTLTVARK